MALIITGKSLCAICGEVIAKGDEVVATSHFLGPSEPLHRYSDAPFHKRCFLTWDRREEFVTRYNDVTRGIALHHMAADGSFISHETLA